MPALRLIPLAAVVLFAAACVTINVYFPAVAAEKAADRIIEDVWGPGQKPAGETPSTQPEGESPEGESPQSRAPASARSALAALGGSVLRVLIPAAHAAQPDIDVSSPAIRRITASMEQRHKELRPYYESGAIGLTRDAEVAVRDLNAVPLPERGRLRKLVDAENRDRNALYREIAVANDHPEWEADIRGVFARRWIEKAPAGWYYRTEDGDWKRK